MNIVEITTFKLALGYALLALPLGIILWYRVPVLGKTAIALVRMTAQLAFVGIYLHVIFDYNNTYLNIAWLLVMIIVADASIIHGCGLSLRRFAPALFSALLGGTAIPLLFFVGLILNRPGLFDAQYAIPIGGMILGNCLRADIVGIRSFYESIRAGEKPFLHALSQGATLTEAVRPFLRNAFLAALAPTVATMATIGLVSLPGMMTGVILGGADPVIAIKYQIAIMIAIFSGTAITLVLAIRMTMHTGFTRYGILDKSVFKK
ncbi:MAG: ABC transporter permease [Sedimentisphaerales bacterium]|nr:ABC transporter permease [Sedimentisphaerales bacterium]